MLQKKVANRRELYDFAEAKHQTNPAEIEVGKPHDLNPASYEDTKKIIREESIIAGISKYGSGERSWFAFVCDGSPFKNFLSLFNVLFFCNLCKKPCGEMKKHVKEIHWGKQIRFKWNLTMFFLFVDQDMWKKMCLVRQ